MRDIVYKGMNEEQVKKITEMNYCSGIYAIICRKTNRVYIGQSENTRIRINSHFSALSESRHEYKEMQKDYTLYRFTF